MDNILGLLGALLLLAVTMCIPPGCTAYSKGITKAHMVQIETAIDACEKSLPRDQVCEAVITARVKGTSHDH